MQNAPFHVHFCVCSSLVIKGPTPGPPVHHWFLNCWTQVSLQRRCSFHLLCTAQHFFEGGGGLSYSMGCVFVRWELEIKGKQSFTDAFFFTFFQLHNKSWRADWWTSQRCSSVFHGQNGCVLFWRLRGGIRSDSYDQWANSISFFAFWIYFNGKKFSYFSVLPTDGRFASRLEN